MNSRSKLIPSMTVTQFDNGYWYATELKAFARSIGIPSAAGLRKDELEETIRRFLRTGKIRASERGPASTRGVRDVERGLRLDRPVAVYTNDPETKNFLEREARKLSPGFKRRSGARYRLNRWREDRVRKGVAISYRDLVEEYVRLNRPESLFARIPHVRYINFLSDFLANERDATREAAIRAWKELKRTDAPKTYRGWRAAVQAAPGRARRRRRSAQA